MTGNDHPLGCLVILFCLFALLIAGEYAADMLSNLKGYMAW